MLWKIEIRPAAGERNRMSERIAHEATDLGLLAHGGSASSSALEVSAAHGFLIQGNMSQDDIEKLGRELLADPVVEQFRVALVDDALWQQPPAENFQQLIHVLPKPGVMDPVAQSTLSAISDNGFQADAVRTFRNYWFGHLSQEQLHSISDKLLANDAIEQAIVGPLPFKQLECGTHYEFALQHVAMRELDDAGLMKLSREGQLYLQLAEMQTIRDKFCELQRDPTDIELETLAQTWSEHCSHKTLAGRVHYQGVGGERQYNNLLKETIFAATVQIRKEFGPRDWCVSVFKDNAGVVRFDDQFNICFKVETHNHPSAIEPYGGANTGLGGVIRDPMGTGLGAKPVCSTDVFCFAPPTTAADSLPPGVLHPRRVMKGVVSGVRDYGNRMGIPTVNGAICFDERYLGNPLVYCGNVGLLPRDKTEKQVHAGDFIIALGGRTGRDGIHGATFSSAELTSESESLSGGAVQIGNAITEKMVLDVVLQARDLNLMNAVTDCGAGGFSSAVGEMGAELGARVDLDKAPLKYDGLSYTEIWISEAQERMVLSVAPKNWPALQKLAQAEGVEASIIGEFLATGQLELRYHGQQVGVLDMHFLHDGRPPVVRQATYQPAPVQVLKWPAQFENADNKQLLLQLLGDWNICSKEWVIRQYDHEVQAGSVVKPLVGAQSDGPSDAAVVRPVLGSHRGIAISCGIGPSFGDHDTYHMAAGAIDEAVRNAVAVGADPKRIAILDNFCWGDCEKPETLGALVRAAQACFDVAVAWQTPFISGKDSLNNEFRYQDAAGTKQTIAIPHTLLISAMAQIDDVRKCVTMDFKQPGNLIYLVGRTHAELGGSRLAEQLNAIGGFVPVVDLKLAPQIFHAMYRAIQAGYIAACHDVSEGGLAVALAEMALAGDIGATISFSELPGAVRRDDCLSPNDYAWTLLGSESHSRFLCEVAPEHALEFGELMAGVPFTKLGQTTTEKVLSVTVSAPQDDRSPWQLNAPITELKAAWQKPLKW